MLYERTGEGGLAGSGDVVQAAAGPALAGRGLGILPAALEEPGGLHPPERLVEGAVTGERSGALTVAEDLRRLEPVELGMPLTVRGYRDLQERDLQREEGSGLAPDHGRFIGRYLPIVNPGVTLRRSA
jgi:hypothetical protein